MGNKFVVSEGNVPWLKKNVNCQFNCPVDTNVPEYIEKISQGKYAEAYEINRHSNVLVGVMGRICTHPCEEICRRCLIDEPIAIRDLKRVAADFGFKDAPKLPKTAGTLPTRIAIVGGGPTGLVAARDLAEVGHSVMIYEGLEKLGGQMWAGIPDYRLPREVTDAEIEANILALGVEYKLNSYVGRDIMLSDLLEEYDAVLMAAGTYKEKPLGVENENHPKVVPGLKFMMDYNRGLNPEVGTRVAVLGGGFTAVDCVRSAVRLGAKKVSMLYRRTLEEMSATEEEINLMEPEGIEIKTLVSPNKVVLNPDGSLRGIEMIRNKLGDPDSSGRRKAVAIEGSEFVYECDLVVVAFGQDVDLSWCQDLIGPKRDIRYPELKLHRSGGWAERDKKTMMTNIPGLFIAGDFFNGASDVVHAMGEGHSVAVHMDRYLKTNKVLEPDLQAIQIKRPVFAPGYDGVRRQHMDLLPIAARRKNPYEEVELGLTREQGKTEASRCLLCQNNINIDPDKCILCGLCVEACPYDVLYMIPADDLEGDKPGVIPAEGAVNEIEYSGMLLDEKRCIRCGLCVDACPTYAIDFIKIIDQNASYIPLVEVSPR
ncbi:MAG TPA: FAD-dependent oxidoreductase [Chloroflexia bacterium]|nr:FAD-dependent oxidoreductase [Chloroflexia bacterium]